MEDEPDTSPAAPTQPSPEDGAEAEDTTPQDAPAEPADDPDESGSDLEEPSAHQDPPPSTSHDLPRTTTTGDDAEDLRAPGDGAVSAAPGDELDDSAQRHD